MLEFNLLLDANMIPQDQTLVLRHRPQQPLLRKHLLFVASQMPEVFNAYQQTQQPKTEKQMERATYVASFIGDKAGRAVFAGMFENMGHTKSTRRSREKNPSFTALSKYDHPNDDRTCHWFDLRPMTQLSEYRLRLIIGWQTEIAWSRWAIGNSFNIVAITEDPLISSKVPAWQTLVLRWDELSCLPVGWKTAMAQWRGVYLIYDKSDGKSYVGSASGEDNILGRWLNYASSGHGNNKVLRKRDPDNFEFSILQRVSPDLEIKEVVALENTWKLRLHTLDQGLNLN